MSTFVEVIDVYNEHGIKVPGLRKCQHIKENGEKCECITFIKDVNGKVVCSACLTEVNNEM